VNVLESLDFPPFLENAIFTLFQVLSISLKPHVSKLQFSFGFPLQEWSEGSLAGQSGYPLSWLLLFLANAAFTLFQKGSLIGSFSPGWSEGSWALTSGFSFSWLLLFLAKCKLHTLSKRVSYR
jgi:hypothetical protein